MSSSHADPLNYEDATMLSTEYTRVIQQVVLDIRDLYGQQMFLRKKISND